jgi:uncharacterized protein YndB with AHSA1/START domain
MTAPKASEAIEREVRVAASPEVVFGFFIDPAKMILWKGLDAMLDARPGGIYRVVVTNNDIARGEYVEIVPHSRVVFTWGWENSPIPPGSTTVEISLTPDGDGTIVRLRHTGLASEAVLQHDQGWNHYLSRLVIAAGGGDPGPDPHAAGTMQLGS